MGSGVLYWEEKAEEGVHGEIASVEGMGKVEEE